MNSTHSEWASSAICVAADQIMLSWQEAARAIHLPHVIYKPDLSRDGDMWCALFGDNLQEGVSGFGNTPALAMAAFDVAWFSERGDHTIDSRPAPDTGEGE